MAVLPGVGAKGRAPRHDGGPHSAIPALLLLGSAHRQPRLAAHLLVVFEDEIVQTHFLHVARQEMERTGVSVPQEPAGGSRAVGTRLTDNRRRGTRLRLREPALSILSPITQSPLSRGDGTALVVKKVSPVDNHIIDSLVPQETIGGG